MMSMNLDFGGREIKRDANANADEEEEQVYMTKERRVQLRKDIQIDLDGLKPPHLPKRIVISDPKKRSTPPYWTKFEKARAVGIRTMQLTQGAPTTDLDPRQGQKEAKNNKTMGTRAEAETLARRELAQGRIPLKIRRPIPGHGTAEEWNSHELIDEPLYLFSDEMLEHPTPSKLILS